MNDSLQREFHVHSSYCTIYFLRSMNSLTSFSIHSPPASRMSLTPWFPFSFGSYIVSYNTYVVEACRAKHLSQCKRYSQVDGCLSLNIILPTYHPLILQLDLPTRKCTHTQALHSDIREIILSNRIQLFISSLTCLNSHRCTRPILAPQASVFLRNYFRHPRCAIFRILLPTHRPRYICDTNTYAP